MPIDGKIRIHLKIYCYYRDDGRAIAQPHSRGAIALLITGNGERAIALPLVKKLRARSLSLRVWTFMGTGRSRIGKERSDRLKVGSDRHPYNQTKPPAKMGERYLFWSCGLKGRSLLSNQKHEKRKMQINIELNQEYESKLVYVQQKTDQQDLKAVIEAAIDAYYSQLEAPRKTALEIFSESGFIGCIHADENLSTNYKSIVRSAIQERFNRSQEL
jgi:hypothetical protein